MKKAFLAPFVLGVASLAFSSIGFAATTTTYHRSTDPISGLFNATGNVISGVGNGVVTTTRGVVRGTGEVVGGTVRGTGQVVGGTVRGTRTMIHGVTGHPTHTTVIHRRSVTNYPYQH